MGKSATPSLGELERRGLAIEAACSCGHRRIIPPSFLLTLTAPETVLYPFVLKQLASRFRCAGCQAYGPTLTVGRFE